MRATYPIPAACGIYYFEVKIVSKGRDGYVDVAELRIYRMCRLCRLCVCVLGEGGVPLMAISVYLFQ